MHHLQRFSESVIPCTKSDAADDSCHKPDAHNKTAPDAPNFAEYFSQKAVFLLVHFDWIGSFGISISSLYLQVVLSQRDTTQNKHPK